VRVHGARRDASACAAVILGEPGSGDLAAYLEHALVRLMPAATSIVAAAMRRPVVSGFCDDAEGMTVVRY
jgi:uncharacterized protein with PIN domain